LLSIATQHGGVAFLFVFFIFRRWMYAVFACEDMTEEGGQMTNKYDITSRSYSYKGDIV
jgi:hypothetical protein